MRRYVLAVLPVIFFATSALAEPDQITTSRIYDEEGRYQGRIIEKENGDAVVYDAKGRFWGRIRQ